MEVTIVIRQMWSGRFNGMMFFFLLSIFQLNATTTISVNKIFEQEIEVPEGTTIRTEGPGSPDMHLHGTMSSSSERGAYTLKGKKGGLIMKIDRKFNIFTWDKNVVKHKVVVTIEADNAAMEKEILDALTMDLQLSPDNSLEIDCFLGIRKITMRNGWFKDDDNTLIMRSGKEIKFRSLTISSILTIPKNSNLDMKSKYMNITLGELNGTANLDLTGSIFTAKYVQDLKAKLKQTELTINEVKTASVSAHHSKIMLLEAEDIQIGKLLLDNLALGFDVWSHHHYPENSFDSAKDARMKSKYSSTNKYTFKDLDKLEVYSSLNDKFSMNELGELNLMDVAFSEVDISKLKKKAQGQFDFGELNVYGLDKTAFEHIILTSSFGSLRIFGQDSEDLKLVVKNISKKKVTVFETSEFQVAESLQIGPKYKMTSTSGQSEFIYQKGNYKEADNQKGLIHLTCDYCDLKLN